MMYRIAGWSALVAVLGVLAFYEVRLLGAMVPVVVPVQMITAPPVATQSSEAPPKIYPDRFTVQTEVVAVEEVAPEPVEMAKPVKRKIKKRRRRVRR